MPSVLKRIAQHPIIPVILIDRAEDAVPLGKALIDGGLPVLEVTLRTEAALEAISLMAQELPKGIVGAGTLRKPSDVEAALKAGAEFGVSPGSPSVLLDAVKANGLETLPGVGSATEAMTAHDAGFDFLKLFPASASGGPTMLKSLASPLQGLLFCPTGGVSPANAHDYFACPNVACVGGSWMVPKNLVKDQNWDTIRKLAQEARALANQAEWEPRLTLD